METSPTLDKLAKALVEFHKIVHKVVKDSKNDFLKNKYASLSTILSTVDKPLSDNGLAIIQLPCEENGLITILLHNSGEYISSTYSMTPVDNKPQTKGSALTYQRRYAVGAILSLNIDDDDDGHLASKVPDNKVSVPKAPATDLTNSPIFNEDVHDPIDRSKSMADQVNEVFDVLADPGAPAPVITTRRTFIVQSITKKKAAATGNDYVTMDTSIGNIVAFKNTMDKFVIGDQYDCELEKGKLGGYAVARGYWHGELR